jgi:AraC-like DNA-binding protein
MGLIASLPEIDQHPLAVFVLHEEFEKLIPLHVHTKGQLSYVEGGVAHITVGSNTYVVPARHYFWVPAGLPHVLRIGQFGTVLRSLYFYARQDGEHPFYSTLGIYPAPELLIQMISYTRLWDGQAVSAADENFEFLVALKNLLPQLSNKSLPIVLPLTEDARMNAITQYLRNNLAEPLSLSAVSARFGMSERSLSRLFQALLHISFLQYLKTLRMIQAIELLLKSKQTISEIAFSVGYHNIGSFSNAFVEFTNSRPSDFRRD